MLLLVIENYNYYSFRFEHAIVCVHYPLITIEGVKAIGSYQEVLELSLKITVSQQTKPNIL